MVGIIDVVKLEFEIYVIVLCRRYEELVFVVICRIFCWYMWWVDWDWELCVGVVRMFVVLELLVVRYVNGVLFVFWLGVFWVWVFFWCR